METNQHDLSNLFRQLGYSGEAEDIDLFLARNRLAKGVALTDAVFWSPSQAHFLKSALVDDSDWCEAVDELSVRLTGSRISVSNPWFEFIKTGSVAITVN